MSGTSALMASYGAVAGGIPTANMIANWDANLGVTSSGGLVSAWADQSGNGRTLASAGSTRPAITGTGTSTILTFDGTNDYMDATFAMSQPTTVYAVIKQITWTSGDYLWDGKGIVEMALIQHTSTPMIAPACGTFGGDNSDLTVNTVKVVTVVYNGASSTTSVNDGTKATGNPGSTSISGFTLGQHGSFPGNASNIGVQEIIIYSVAHSAAIQTGIISALRTKWGV